MEKEKIELIDIKLTQNSRDGNPIEQAGWGSLMKPVFEKRTMKQSVIAQATANPENLAFFENNFQRL